MIVILHLYIFGEWKFAYKLWILSYSETFLEWLCFWWDQSGSSGKVCIFTLLVVTAVAAVALDVCWRSLILESISYMTYGTLYVMTYMMCLIWHDLYDVPYTAYLTWCALYDVTYMMCLIVDANQSSHPISIWVLVKQKWYHCIFSISTTITWA